MGRGRSGRGGRTEVQILACAPFPRAWGPDEMTWVSRVLAARLQGCRTFRDKTNSKIRGTAHRHTTSRNLFHRIFSFPPTTNRDHGVRATRKASELEAVQIFRRRSLARVAIRVKAILHKRRDKMLSHVHGAELNYIDWIQFCGGQFVDAAMV
jgi:hypothetical protein